jgi:Protein of unknown function (DUF3147)
MRIRVDTSSVRLTRWYEYLIRFILGGAVTVATGLIAKKFGPGVGGLFLAFPAILPASATLIEKHEIERKRRAGIYGMIRARKAVGADAAGAAIGSFGMLTFAIIIWKFLPDHKSWLVLGAATVAWFTVAFALWAMRSWKRAAVRAKWQAASTDHS